jgi:hypothetical protein
VDGDQISNCLRGNCAFSSLLKLVSYHIYSLTQVVNKCWTEHWLSCTLIFLSASAFHFRVFHYWLDAAALSITFKVQAWLRTVLCYVYHLSELRSQNSFSCNKLDILSYHVTSSENIKLGGTWKRSKKLLWWVRLDTKFTSHASVTTDQTSHVGVHCTVQYLLGVLGMHAWWCARHSRKHVASVARALCSRRCTLL